MANIQQAAKWLSEGRDVERSTHPGFWLVSTFPKCLVFEIVCEDGGVHELDIYDLQADDWQLIL